MTILVTRFIGLRLCWRVSSRVWKVLVTTWSVLST